MFGLFSNLRQEIEDGFDLILERFQQWSEFFSNQQLWIEKLNRKVSRILDSVTLDEDKGHRYFVQLQIRHENGQTQAASEVISTERRILHENDVMAIEDYYEDQGYERVVVTDIQPLGQTSVLENNVGL